MDSWRSMSMLLKPGMFSPAENSYLNTERMVCCAALSDTEPVACGGAPGSSWLTDLSFSAACSATKGLARICLAVADFYSPGNQPERDTAGEAVLTAVLFLLPFARRDTGGRKSLSTSPAIGWSLTSLIPIFNHREWARTGATQCSKLYDWSTRSSGRATHTACKPNQNDAHNLVGNLS